MAIDFKRISLFSAYFILFCTLSSKAEETTTLTSPDQQLSVQVVLREKIYYMVSFKGERVLELSPISLTLDRTTLGKNPQIKRISQTSVNQKIKTVWGSRKEIVDNYNQLSIDFEGSYSVIFRVYNNGVAYHFETQLKDKTLLVKDEEVAYRFKFGVSAWLPESKSYETSYKKFLLDGQNSSGFNNVKDKLFLPIVVQSTPTAKVAITEAGLYDYPSLFLARGNDFENFLTGLFEPYALTTKTGGSSNYSQLADKEAPYIATVNGQFSFPWRLMVISDDDRTFADCDLVYQLSRPAQLKETDWIKPGKVAWDWWHDYVVEGKAFRGGINTNTYLYEIDFAAKYGLNYILIDWMWTDKYDLSLISPDIDLRKITDYASKNNVKVIVWCPAHTLHQSLDKTLDLFSSFGIAGIKADFFGREDQTGIRMYEDIAKAAAARKMLVDFHGSAKPTGLSRTYPNVINCEAVAGNEWNKLKDICTVNHKSLLPFIRGLQGPMDYTPGGMRNSQSGHSIRSTLPEVHGTRSNEMALYVLYNEPLKMLCDAPSSYEREQEITKFIARIPTVWDETKVLEAEFGTYLVEARQTNDTWYVAGITNDQSREINVDFSFLNEGNFTAQLVKDTPNSDRIGTDYLFDTLPITKNSKLTLKMASGGGFIICIKKM